MSAPRAYLQAEHRTAFVVDEWGSCEALRSSAKLFVDSARFCGFVVRAVSALPANLLANREFGLLFVRQVAPVLIDTHGDLTTPTAICSSLLSASRLTRAAALPSPWPLPLPLLQLTFCSSASSARRLRNSAEKTFGPEARPHVYGRSK